MSARTLEAVCFFQECEVTRVRGRGRVRVRVRVRVRRSTCPHAR